MKRCERSQLGIGHCFNEVPELVTVQVTAELGCVAY